MNIAVIGVGGVGGYFGGRLAAAGNNVCFVARGETYKSLFSRGLTVKSINGDIVLTEVHAVDSVAKLVNPDLVIIAVKAWQLKDVVAELKNVIHKNSVIMPMLNGITASDEIMEQIERRNVLKSLCRIISKIESPGVINHFGVDPAILFGELDNSKTERVLKIKELFDKASIKSDIPDDMDAELWKKYIAICVSALLGVTRSTYGELREVKETRQMMLDLMNEVYSLSKAAGVNVGSDFVNKTMSFIDSFPYDSTSSLTRDVWEGNPSEIECQNGHVVRLGAKLGIPTPVNSFVYNCILPMERRARGKNDKR